VLLHYNPIKLIIATRWIARISAITIRVIGLARISDRAWMPAQHVLSAAVNVPLPLLKQQLPVITHCPPIGQDAIGCHLQQP